jgi:hypothetical protein
MGRKIIDEVKFFVATVAMLASGFVGGVALFGLIPGDSTSVNTVGALVLIVVCGPVFWASHRYVNRWVHRAQL